VGGAAASLFQSQGFANFFQEFRKEKRHVVAPRGIMEGSLCRGASSHFLLAEDIMNSKPVSKPRVLSVLVVFVGLLGLGAGNLLHPAAGQTGPPGGVGLPTGQSEKAGKQARSEKSPERKTKDPFTVVVDVDLKDLSLQDAIADLSGRLSINVVIDRNDLKEKQIPLDVPVKLRLRKVPIKTALKHLLRQGDLGYTVEDDILIIASAETARGRMVRKIYPVADLAGEEGVPVALVQIGGPMGQMPGGALGALGGGMGLQGGFGALGGGMGLQGGFGALGGGLGALGGGIGALGGGFGALGGGRVLQGGLGGGQQWLHIGDHQLIQVITKTVAPNTWSEAGGPGSIAYLPAAGCLVVSHCSEIQDQIRSLIEELQAAKKRQAEELALKNPEIGGD
jgi:hypothetical protein